MGKTAEAVPSVKLARRTPAYVSPIARARRAEMTDVAEVVASVRITGLAMQLASAPDASPTATGKNAVAMVARVSVVLVADLARLVMKAESAFQIHAASPMMLLGATFPT